MWWFSTVSGLLSAPMFLRPLFGLPAASVADENETGEATIAGTLPALALPAIASYFDWGLSRDGAGEAAFDQGYVESDTSQTTLPLNANGGGWRLEDHYNGAGWSCPAGRGKAEADLQLRVANTPTRSIQKAYGP